MALSKLVFSGSTNGRPVKVVATASAGTTIHTAHATALDEITMYFTNTDTTDRTVTVEFGGTTSPDDKIQAVVPSGQSVLVIPGIPLTNSLVVKAFASAANVLTAWGYVNRIA